MPVRRYASAVYAMALSVRPSVTNREFKMAIDRLSRKQRHTIASDTNFCGAAEIPIESPPIEALDADGGG